MDSDGVPDAPSASLRRSRATFGYDELGRVFAAKTYAVDPSAGTIGNALTTSMWYDSRGLTIKTLSVGGLVSKTAHDGLGRPTKQYSTDGGGDSVYGDADDVTGDIVLEQSEAFFDANSNPVLTLSRQRFHDAPGSGTGATGELGTPASSQPKARVYYETTYYDALDRPTASVNVGTNGGSSYTRPGSTPSRSDTVLVNSYTYDDAGRLFSTTDPKGNVNRTYYDLLGRTTKTIEAYVDGTPSANDDRTTEYTYNANSDVATLKAVLPAGAYQETKYVYGVSPATGSTLFSNRRVAGHRVSGQGNGCRRGFRTGDVCRQ